jgi:hypothetical protein
LLRGGGFNEPQLREQLVRRTAGYEQESAEVGHRPTAAALGDVRDDRLGGSYSLIGAGKCSRIPERSGKSGAVFGNTPGDLKHQ